MKEVELTDIVDLALGDIEIRIKRDGKVLWINSSEKGCILRICKIKGSITIMDERR